MSKKNISVICKKKELEFIPAFLNVIYIEQEEKWTQNRALGFITIYI